MNGTQWTEAEDAILKENYGHLFMKDIAKLVGRTRSAGHQRVRKLGLVMPENRMRPFIKRNRNKPSKDEILRVKMMNWVPVGTERIDSKGHVNRKVSDINSGRRDWRPVYLINWEAAHGQVPKGFIIRFKDGNRTNSAIDNLECISRYYS